VKETKVIEKSLRVQSILSAQPAAVPIISAVLTFLAMTLTRGCAYRKTMHIIYNQITLYYRYIKLSI